MAVRYGYMNIVAALLAHEHIDVNALNAVSHVQLLLVDSILLLNYHMHFPSQIVVLYAGWIYRPDQRFIPGTG